MSLTPLVNLPTPSDPATFDARADNFVTVQLPNLVNEWNTDIALFNNQDTRSTSTTSLVVGTGSKSLTVGTGKMYQPNMTIRIGAVAVANTFMEGVVTSYDSTTGALVVNVIYFLGTGTIASWNTFLVPSIFSGGNLSFSGTANRITGDFNNATFANRVLFQSSVAGASVVGVIPNDVASTAGYNFTNSNNTTNYSSGSIIINASEVSVNSTRAGTGSFLPLVFTTSNLTRMTIGIDGNVGVGATANSNEKLKITNISSANNVNIYQNSIASGQTNQQFLVSVSNTGADVEFILRNDGNAFADGSWSGGGADYAEYFEWKDGNPNNEDRRGISVTLVGEKIKPATQGETIIGVISGNPSVVGDSAWNFWKGKYLLDDFGTYILEEVEMWEWVETIDDTKKEHQYFFDRVPSDVEVPNNKTVRMESRRKLNPDYVEAEYTPREQRKEWDTVGLMGKLRIKKGQPTASNWIKMRDVSATVEEWLIR